MDGLAYVNATANYKGISQLPYNIIKAAFKNEDIFKLIKYDTPDALSKPNLTAEEKAALVWTGQEQQQNYSIFFVPFVENIVPNSKVIVKLYRDQLIGANANVGISVFNLELMCQSRCAMLDDGRARTEVLFELFMSVINGNEINGITQIFFDEDCLSQEVLDNTHGYLGSVTAFKVNCGDVSYR